MMTDTFQRPARVCREVDQLIVGATFAGLGRAMAEPEGSLLVEPSAGVGGEFIEALNPGCSWDRPHAWPAAEAWRLDLMRRGALTPRGVHLPALVPALAEGLLASGAATLLLCDVAAVVPAGDGFEVDLVAPDGWRRVRARRVFDTSTTALSLRSAAAPPAPKRLHAALNTMGGGGDGPLPSGEGFRLIAGAFVREAYLSLDIPADADWPAAREALHAFWTGRPETLKQRGPGVFELPIHRHDFAIIQVE